MKKLNISAEDARGEAMRFGLTIPEEQFEERKLSRGRPKKDASASDTDSSTSSSSSKKEKKSRGRPKKQSKVVGPAKVMTSSINWFPRHPQRRRPQQFPRPS